MKMDSGWFQSMVKINENSILTNKLFQDKIIKTPNDAETIEESEKWRHLVFLRSNNEEIGVLGLLSYIKPDAGPEGKCRPGWPRSFGSPGRVDIKRSNIYEVKQFIRIKYLFSSPERSK